MLYWRDTWRSLSFVGAVDGSTHVVLAGGGAIKLCRPVSVVRDVLDNVLPGVLGTVVISSMWCYSSHSALGYG